jgi:tetratricopeptide (TPR) repeat protein
LKWFSSKISNIIVVENVGRIDKMEREISDRACPREGGGHDLSLQHRMQRERLLFAAVIVLVVLVTYLNSIRNGFVYDDSMLVVENRYEETRPLLSPFIGALSGGAYRPLRDVSHAIDRLIWKQDPMGHHITNVLIHALAAVVVFQIGLCIFREVMPEGRESAVWPAFLAAIFFGIHPIQTECVSWISGRRDILCGLFYLAGLLMFIRYYLSGRKYYIAAIVVCYVLSLSSKEMGVTLPLALILYEYFFMRKREGLAQSKSRMKYIYVSLLVVAVVFSMLTLDVSTGQKRATLYGNSRYLTSLGMAKVMVEYIKLLIFPIDLCAEHMISIPKTIREPAVLGSLLIAAAIVVISAVSFKKNKIVSFCILWFFITLLPVSNVIVPVGNMMAERYMYIPSVGFCLLLGGLIWRVRRKRVAVALVSVLIISYSCLTIIRNRDWKDTFTLWDKTARQSPGSTRPLYNLANAYARRDMYDMAIVRYRELISINPYRALYHNNLGHVYDEKGLREEAREQFEIAARLAPLSGTVHNNLGLMYRKRGKDREAIREFRKAISLEPGNGRFHYDLAVTYEREGKIRESLYHYGEAVALDPSNVQALNNLGCIYFKIGMFDEAKSSWEKVLEINPDFKMAKDNLEQLEILRSAQNDK